VPATERSFASEVFQTAAGPNGSHGFNISGNSSYRPDIADSATANNLNLSRVTLRSFGFQPKGWGLSGGANRSEHFRCYFAMGKIQGTLRMRSHISVHRATTKYFSNSFVFKNEIEKEGLPRDSTPDLGAGGPEFESRSPDQNISPVAGQNRQGVVNESFIRRRFSEPERPESRGAACEAGKKRSIQ
jgi:hypothetical protein